MSLTLAQFTSGSVAGFAGGSGLLETLLAFVLGTEVTAAATSGSGVGPYTASLSTPVGLGRTVLKYTISSVDYEAQDDGTGNFTGTQISSASVNHSTGAFTVTFGTTPDSAPTLDYLYGNPGQDWRLMVKQNTKDDTIPTPAEPFGSAMKECILHNTGLSGAENVLIGFREWQYPASNAYGWDLTGYLSYTSGMLWQESLDDMAQDTYSGTWEHWSACPMLPLADDTMYYWFNSNQQRITGAVKISSNYESFYLGFGNRYGNPEDYPNPLFICGSAVGDKSYTDSVSTTHAFVPAAGGGGKHHSVLPDNSWSVQWGTGIGQLQTILHPLHQWTDAGTLYQSPSKKENLLSPVIASRQSRRFTLFELDGLYHVAGIGVQSEDQIRATDGIKYRVFQNITNVDDNDFMCIAEEEFTTTSTSTTTSSSTTTTS
jgi:hypothetical protein